MDDTPGPASSRRAARWGLTAGAALIVVTALALLVVTVTLSNDRCEQASGLLAGTGVIAAEPPSDPARALPSDDPVTGATPTDQPLNADEIALAFSDPELARPLLDEHGFLDGIARAWRGQRTLASVWLLTFSGPNGAGAFARELVVLTCDHAEQVFGVGGVVGGVGMRLRFDGGVQDEVVFPHGSMVLVVGYTYPGDEPPGIDAAEQLARAARASVTAAPR